MAYTLRSSGIFDLPPGPSSAFAHTASLEPPVKNAKRSKDDDD